MSRRSSKCDTRQLTLDWFGGALDHVPLPATGDVSSDVLRAVLIAVYRLPESYGGKRGHPCWAGQVKIAEWATGWLRRPGRGVRSVSERTARRALAALESRFGYLTSLRASRPDCRTKATLDHYVIDWTAVASALDQERGVTRQPATRPAPATRPGPEGDSADEPMAGIWPVDRPDWPVDRPDWPVDRPDWPVDPETRNISARVPEGLLNQESNTTTTNPDPEDGRAESRTDGWVEVEEVLRAEKIGIRGKLIQRWRELRRDPGAVLAEVRDVVATVHAHQADCRAGVPNAIAYTLANGHDSCPWPIVSAVQVKARQAVRDNEAIRRRWSAECHQAWQTVRARTPVGRAVDDVAVVAEAVSRGVPRGFAERERGLVAGGGCVR